MDHLIEIKANHILVSILLISAFALMANTSIVHADNALNWQKITQADAKLQTAQTDWNYTRSIAPQSSATKDAYESITRQLRIKGFSEDEVKREVETSQKFDEELVKGIKSNGKLRGLRRGEEIRIDKWLSSEIDNIETPEKLIINYTDGKIGLYIDGNDVNSKYSLPEWGRVVNPIDSTKTLVSVQDSSYRLLLFAMPLTSLFPQAKTIMKDEGNAEISLETIENPEGEAPITIRAIVSKKTWRPIKIERFPPHTSKPSKIFESYDFRLYDGVWLPTRFTYSIPANQDTITCVLQKATIGGEIPDEDIKIMYGPNIQDCRFGDCIQYKLVSGIIPDEEKVNELKSGTPSEEIPSDDEHSMEKPPLFALLLLGLGSISLWGGNLIYNAYKK